MIFGDQREHVTNFDLVRPSFDGLVVGEDADYYHYFATWPYQLIPAGTGIQFITQNFTPRANIIIEEILLNGYSLNIATQIATPMTVAQVQIIQANITLGIMPLNFVSSSGNLAGSSPSLGQPYFDLFLPGESAHKVDVPIYVGTNVGFTFTYFGVYAALADQITLNVTMKWKVAKSV